MSIQDDLVKTINKKYKKEGIELFSEGEVTPSDINMFIPSGCDGIDLAVSNRPFGGWPVGRIVELVGLPGSGKSMLAASAIAQVQKLNGLGVYIDTESAMYKEFFYMLGVQKKNFIYSNEKVLDHVYLLIEEIILKYRESNTENPVVIVIDSIMGATTKDEDSSGFSKEGYGTEKATLNSKALRKITQLISSQNILLILTNQLRENVGASFGEKYVTSGGKAVGYHSSVRCMLRQVGKLKNNDLPDPIVGTTVKLEVFKNRIAAPYKVVTFDFYFNSGIDNASSLLSLAEKYEIVSKAGTWKTYKFGDKDIKFQNAEQFRQKLEEVEGFYTSLYEQLCEKYVKKYEVGVDYSTDSVVKEKE